MWKPFNENNPFAGGPSFGKEGEMFGKKRWDAMKAMQAGTASAEQIELVEDADKAYQKAMAARPHVQ
jgi:hypothetical protein